MSGYIWTRALGVVMLAVLLVTSACGGHQPTSGKDKAQQVAWSTFILAHTSGVVSRKKNVHVRFVTDVAPADATHVDTRGMLSIEPGLEGTVAFAGPREVS